MVSSDPEAVISPFYSQSDGVARCAPTINVGAHASHKLKELALQNLKHLIDEIQSINQ